MFGDGTVIETETNHHPAKFNPFRAIRLKNGVGGGRFRANGPQHTRPSALPQQTEDVIHLLPNRGAGVGKN